MRYDRYAMYIFNAVAGIEICIPIINFVLPGNYFEFNTTLSVVIKDHRDTSKFLKVT